MIDLVWARAFAQDWIAAWNSHDLERILAHYSEDVEMSSPLIVERMGKPSGQLRGKQQVRPYWQRGLEAQPALQFELLDVFAGVESITLYYRSIGRRLACEVLYFNAERQVIRGVAHYAAAEPLQASRSEPGDPGATMG